MRTYEELKSVLIKFQQAYDESDIQKADALMADVFSKRADLLAIGTGTWEVCLGRDEIKQLIKDDWDGGWGDFELDLASAKIDLDENVAWFYLDATVKYEFKNPDDEKNADHNQLVAEILANEKASPKQKLSFLNWALSFNHHRQNDTRECLWPAEFSGMMINEDGHWKIATMDFAMAKPNYPTERYEDLLEDYQGAGDSLRNQLVKREKSKIDDELFAFLRATETTIDFTKEQIAVFTEGNFSWLMAIAREQKIITEAEVFANTMAEINELSNSEMSEAQKLFATKRSIAFALKEVASGSSFTWPIKLSAVVEKSADGYKFRQKHYSYSFNWYFEGLY